MRTGGSSKDKRRRRGSFDAVQHASSFSRCLQGMAVPQGSPRKGGGLGALDFRSEQDGPSSPHLPKLSVARGQKPKGKGSDLGPRHMPIPATDASKGQDKLTEGPGNVEGLQGTLPGASESASFAPSVSCDDSVGDGAEVGSLRDIHDQLFLSLVSAGPSSVCEEMAKDQFQPHVAPEEPTGRTWTRLDSGTLFLSLELDALEAEASPPPGRTACPHPPGSPVHGGHGLYSPQGQQQQPEPSARGGSDLPPLSFLSHRPSHVVIPGDATSERASGPPQFISAAAVGYSPPQPLSASPISSDPSSDCLRVYMLEHQSPGVPHSLSHSARLGHSLTSLPRSVSPASSGLPSPPVSGQSPSSAVHRISSSPRISRQSPFSSSGRRLPVDDSVLMNVWQSLNEIDSSDGDAVHGNNKVGKARRGRHKSMDGAKEVPAAVGGEAGAITITAGGTNNAGASSNSDADSPGSRSLWASISRQKKTWRSVKNPKLALWGVPSSQTTGTTQPTAGVRACSTVRALKEVAAFSGGGSGDLAVLKSATVRNAGKEHGGQGEEGGTSSASRSPSRFSVWKAGDREASEGEKGLERPGRRGTHRRSKSIF